MGRVQGGDGRGGLFRSWMATVTQKGHFRWDGPERKLPHKTPTGKDNNYDANFRTRQCHHLTLTWCLPSAKQWSKFFPYFHSLMPYDFT